MDDVEPPKAPAPYSMTLPLFLLGSVLVFVAGWSYMLFAVSDDVAYALLFGPPIFYALTALFATVLHLLRRRLSKVHPALRLAISSMDACLITYFLAAGMVVWNAGSAGAFVESDPLGFAATVGAPLFMFLLPTLVVCWLWAYRPRMTLPRMLAIALVSLAPAMLAYAFYASRMAAALAT